MPTGSGDLEIMAFGRLLPGRLRPIYLTSHSQHKSPKQTADLKEVAGKEEGFWEQRCDEMGTELKITPRFISPCSLAVFLMHRKKTCFISKSIVTTEIWEEEVYKSSGSFQRGIPLFEAFPDPLGTGRLD